MKKLFATLFCLIPVLVMAQKFTDLTLKQAQEKATKEKKIILVDVCNSTHMNAQKTVDQKSVAAFKGVDDFVKTNIIAIRVNMSTDAGREFAPLLQMNMYPTYAFLMPNGDLLKTIHPAVATKNPEKFLEKAVEAYEAAKQKWANTRSINFQQGTFEEALALAKREGKLVFLDAITANCQPCIMMAKNVFTLDKVADFYNKNFISIKLNLGTEFADLAKRYGTSMYPTYLFLDGDGNLVHRGGGFCEADKFLAYGQAALTAREIQFMGGKWSDILELARKYNKPIFLDCFTTWCGPCKHMSETVFKTLEVADFMNANFINVKMDMEKGEGIVLKDRFDVKAFPTLLYFDAEGNEIHRVVGSVTEKDFLVRTKQGLSSGNLGKMTKRFAAGEREQNFLADYLMALDDAYKVEEGAKVAVELFKVVSKEQLKEKKYWSLFKKYVTDVDSELFQYVQTNRDDFFALYSQEDVNRKLFGVWSEAACRFATKDSFDEKGYKAFKKRMKRASVNQYDEIVLTADLSNAEIQGKWDVYTSLLEKDIKTVGITKISEHSLYLRTQRLEKNCTDKVVRARAGVWCAAILPELERRDAEKLASKGKGNGTLSMSLINYKKQFTRLTKVLNE